jgi:hypothetical protein
MASECSGRSASAHGQHVHSVLKADTHAVSQQIQQQCTLTPDEPPGKPAGVNEQDLLKVLELMRLTVHGNY